MPHKVLERQYQLQAQKRHEQNLKFNFYKQTALYFEREAALARQFSSWTNRELNDYSKHLVRSKRQEELLARREKLKRLFVEEEQVYRHELDLEQCKRQQLSGAPSLEQLKLNLLEKKAEQSLYYPSSCRKLQGHTSSPTNSLYKSIGIPDAVAATELRPHHINRLLNHHVDLIPISSNSQNVEKILYNSTKAGKWSSAESISPKIFSEKSCRNPRYTARYSRQSLEGTNICNGDNMDYCSSAFQSLRLNGNPTLVVNDQNDLKNNTNIGTRLKNDREDNQKENVQFTQNEKPLYDAESLHLSDNNSSTSEKADSTVVLNHKSSESLALILPHIAMGQLSAETISNFNMEQYKRRSDYKKETECSTDSNMSVQMYRYLKHNEMKRQILDLCKREHLFVIKQCWSEALRLREMRNEINLLKNKNIFENLDLKINEKPRQRGLKVIKAREALNEKRTKLSNSLFYSDEAKAMWKQWVREDDEITKIETNVMRDLMVHQLEKDWKNLALRDKNLMLQLYDKVMKKSYVQDEHKLLHVIRVANNR